MKNCILFFCTLFPLFDHTARLGPILLIAITNKQDPLTQEVLFFFFLHPPNAHTHPYKYTKKGKQKCGTCHADTRLIRGQFAFLPFDGLFAIKRLKTLYKNKLVENEQTINPTASSQSFFWPVSFYLICVQGVCVCVYFYCYPFFLILLLLVL